MRRYMILAVLLCGCTIERIDNPPGPSPDPAPPAPVETADESFVQYAKGFAGNCDKAASMADAGDTETTIFKWLDEANETARKSAFAPIRLRVAATSPPDGEFNRSAFAAELRKIASEARGLK